eukprot:TRINITY_DN3559_c0_g1_i1.p1 TRINITY_DN3559_c0_g1~~TRINITY_DN3559_c0_g1_i1.p1  ORF type:complete len:319 (+),score=47.64 TRINITY_DN3559_c0_g1_i1:64-1020(+)
MDGDSSLNMSLDEIIQSEKPIFTAPPPAGRGGRGRGGYGGGKIGGRGGGAYDRGSNGILMGTAPHIGMQFPDSSFAGPPAMITPVGMTAHSQIPMLPGIQTMNPNGPQMLPNPATDLLTSSLLQQTAQVAATISKLGGNPAALTTFNNSIPGLATAGSGEALMNNAMDISRVVSQLADKTLNTIPTDDTQGRLPTGITVPPSDDGKPSFVKRGNFVEKLARKRAADPVNPLTFTLPGKQQRADTAVQQRKMLRQKVLSQSRQNDRVVLQPQNSLSLNPPPMPPQKLVDPQREKNIRLGKTSQKLKDRFDAMAGIMKKS